MMNRKYMTECRGCEALVNRADMEDGTWCHACFYERFNAVTIGAPVKPQPVDESFVAMMEANGARSELCAALRSEMAVAWLGPDAADDMDNIERGTE